LIVGSSTVETTAPLNYCIWTKMFKSEEINVGRLTLYNTAHNDYNNQQNTKQNS